MPRKKAETTEASEVREIPTISEEPSGLGSIQINLAVIKSIVHMAAKEVEGVITVGKGGIVDDVSSFIKKDSGSGIHVEEENDSYFITVRLILAFGYELAKTADEVQRAVRDQVSRMTNKNVAKVDIMIEAVRTPDNTKLDVQDDDIDMATHNTD